MKRQCRIEQDFHDEDKTLIRYGEVAEETVLDMIRRSFLDVIVTYNGIPGRIVQASLMLVDTWYNNRSPVISQSMSYVPYTFDLMLKHLMRLSGEEAIPDYDDKLPVGSLVSSDGRVVLDRDYRIVCAKIN